MTKFIMVYASMTGNTEAMVHAIAESIQEFGIELTLVDGYDADASQLRLYDGILIGTYTWNAGDLPDEMMDFYEDLLQEDLTGKKAAVFGSFDSMYGDNGAAIDTFISALKKAGAEVTTEGLKVELAPSAQDLAVCKAFGKTFVDQFIFRE
jgi:flavodoxin I